MAVVARCSLHVSASRPLRLNVTSSVKLEAHNVAQATRAGLSHGHGWSSYKISWGSVHRFQICSRSDRQINRHTDRQSGWSQYSPHPYRGGVIITLFRFTFRHVVVSGWCCTLARHAKDEIYAARHSRKVRQPWPTLWRLPHTRKRTSGFYRATLC